MDEGLDLRREYYLTLAFSQNIAAENGLEPRRLMAHWMSICAECGDAGRYDPFYIRDAIIELGRLPLPSGGTVVANEVLALQGLALWAATQMPNEDSFAIEWELLLMSEPLLFSNCYEAGLSSYFA